MSDDQEAPFDSAAPTPEDLEVSIRRMVEAWNGDWKIIVTRVAQETGLTVEQVMMWEMVMTWNDMVRHIRGNMRWTRAWLEAHGEDLGDDWKDS